MKSVSKIILATALTLTFQGCIEKIEYVQFDDPALFSPTKSEVTDLSQGIPSNPLSSVVETKSSSVDMPTILKGIILGVYGSNVHSISGTYWSVDQNGDPIRLSGKVILPASGKIRNYILVSHYTIGGDFEAPSNSFQLEGILATDGYALIMPDYIGFGATAHLPHPYLCAHLTARNVVDMLLAVDPYLRKIGRAPEDSSIYLMGYSQGGATTMAVQRLLESEYADKYKIRRNFAGGGPYDISATYDNAIENDYLGIPCAIPMIIIGMNVGERLDLNYEDYFRPFLLEHYSEWILDKNYNVHQIAALMKTKILSDFLTPEAMEKRSPGTRKFYMAMMHNSVLRGWQPQAPVYMFHSQDDDTVPFLNSQLAKEAFKNCNIEYNFGHYGSHILGALRFILTVHEILK